MPHEQGLTTDEQDLRSIVEATFGPGAFDLLESDEQSSPQPELSGPRSGSEFRREENNTSCNVSREEAAAGAPPFLVADPTIDKTVILFQLMGSLYSVPINCVTEIQRELPVTAIPRVPPWVLGVTNLRGSIMSVIDVGMRLGMPVKSTASPRHMIVVRLSANEALTGLLVDRVIGIRTLAAWTGTPNGQSSDDAASFVSEWRESDARPAAVLDVETIASLE